VLSKEDMAELNELEVKKYNTRLMLDGLLDSNNVKRMTTSPWDMMKQ